MQVVEVLPAATALSAAEILSLLADESLQKMLWGHSQGEVSVGALAELVGLKPSAVSQHPSRLRLAGMVQERREGPFAFYRACDDHIERIVADLVAHSSEGLAAAGRGVPVDPGSTGTADG